LAHEGSHPAAFRDIAKEINAAARTLVVKQIRSKGTTLGRLREIHAALGTEAFNLAIDGLADAQIESLLGKLDKLPSGARVIHSGMGPQAHSCLGERLGYRGAQGEGGA
jgi:hypothetical protein